MGENTILSRDMISRTSLIRRNSSSGLNVNLFLSVLMGVSNNYYGTSFEAVEAVAKTGRTCILDIEMEVSILYVIYPTLGGDECQKDTWVECEVSLY
jgi:hypothetical protein